MSARPDDYNVSVRCCRYRLTSAVYLPWRRDVRLLFFSLFILSHDKSLFSSHGPLFANLRSILSPSCVSTRNNKWSISSLKKKTQPQVNRAKSYLRRRWRLHRRRCEIVEIFHLCGTVPLIYWHFIQNFRFWWLKDPPVGQWRRR